MKFKDLAVYFDTIEQTASRLEMTRILARLFREISGDEIDKVLYLLQGRISPLYERNDFLLGERMLIRALTKGLNIEQKAFISLNNKIGDLGKAVEQLRSHIKTIEERDLSIVQVFELLVKITTTFGEGSQEKKMSIVAQLVRTLDPLSCRFIVRIPTQTLRLGFSDMTILDSFSWMIAGNKSLRGKIEGAYHVRPDLGFVGKTLKEKGLIGLKDVHPVLFTPIIMMRAERLSNPAEIMEKAPEAVIEPKYDGFRLQVHYKKLKSKNPEVRLFSRSLEDVTFMYPDIVAGVEKEVTAQDIIFEGEAIGFIPGSNSFLPFQETVQRKRKYNIEEKSQEIPLKLFAFELLYANGVNYLGEPFSKRRAILEKAIVVSGNIIDDTLLISPEQNATSAKTIELAFDEAISNGLEGIMIKKKDGIYQPGARGWNWIKFKRSYSLKIEDTIDCLVLGYDLGRGKRSDFGIGAILVGVYNKTLDKYVTVAKIGTGLTDVEWRELRKKCELLTTPSKPALYEVDKLMEADKWTKPGIVLEIKADEITRSPVHTAGRILRKTKSGGAMEVDTSGFALRFPRLEKFRDDKRPEDVTTVKELQKMYEENKH